MATSKKVLETEKIIGIKLGEMRESPFNHRTDFGDLEELAQSMRGAEGRIHQALVVRPSGDKKQPYEIVFGHRRYRAAKLAKLGEAPAVVREMTDAQVKLAQLVENLGRKDINAMEEAEGFDTLQKEGKSPDEIAEAIGKSKAHVYGRLKLLALQPAGKKALLAGAILPSIALLLARIPSPERQDKATKEVLTGGAWDSGKQGVMSVRMAFDHIQNNYMLRLVGAPFRQDDAELYPEAGSCKACPKRTGNQKELFPDVKSADVCTDPDCYKEKVKRNAGHQLKLAEEKGQNVINGKKGVFRKEYAEAGKPQTFAVQSDADFVDPKDSVPGDKDGRSWEKVLGRKLPELALVQDPAGKIHKLLSRAEAIESLRKTGNKEAVKTLKRIEEHRQPSNATPEEKEAERLRYERTEAIGDLSVSIQVSAIKEKLVGPDRLRLALFGHRVEHGAHSGNRGEPKEIWSEIAALAPADVERELVDSLCDSLRHRWLDGARKAVAGELGVDLSAADAEARAMVDATLEEQKAGEKEEANRCTTPDCPNQKKAAGYLYCESCDQKRGADPLAALAQTPAPATECAVPGCGLPIDADGFCTTHLTSLSMPERKSILARNKRLQAEGKTAEGKKARAPRKAKGAQPEATESEPLDPGAVVAGEGAKDDEDGSFPEVAEA